MTPSLEHLADLSVGVVSSEAAHGKAAAALAAAQAARDAVASRLAQARGRLRAIGRRRAQGDLRDDDAQELGVLNADIGGLEDLLSCRDAEVDAAQGPVRASVAALSTARHQLQRAEAQATEAALVSRAEEAARMLTEALQQMRQVRDASLNGGVLPWSVPDALWAALVPIRNLRPWCGREAEQDRARAQVAFRQSLLVSQGTSACASRPGSAAPPWARASCWRSGLG